MVSFAELLLPVFVSAVVVFIASSVAHMVLKFWHAPDYRGFSNEAEVGDAIRKGNAAPGMYMIPFCNADAMKNPDAVEKFKTGPVGLMYLRPNGPMNMGKFMGLWFGFCLLVGLFCALLACPMLGDDAAFANVFHLTAVAAFMGYGFGPIPNGIWRGQPWASVIKDVIDGLVYALITGAIFAWLWPH